MVLGGGRASSAGGVPGGGADARRCTRNGRGAERGARARGPCGPPVRRASSATGARPVASYHRGARPVTIDAYFGLADERLFHLEFQTEHYGATLPRHLAYNGYLYKRYRRSIATVVCCSGGLNVARVRDQGGTIQDCVADVLMGERDGAETDRRDWPARGSCVVGVWPCPSIPTRLLARGGVSPGSPRRAGPLAAAGGGQLAMGGGGKEAAFHEACRQAARSIFITTRRQIGVE